MVDIINETKCLASYAVFSELYNNGMSDIYDVIAEFIKEIVISNGKHQFTESELCKLLNRNYGFSLFESIIKSSLNRIPSIIRKNRMYIVEDKDKIKSNVESSQTEIINQNNKYIYNP